MGSVSPVPSHPVPSSASPIPSRPFRSRLALFSAHVASPLTGRLPHLSRASPCSLPLGARVSSEHLGGSWHSTPPRPALELGRARRRPSSEPGGSQAAISARETPRPQVRPRRARACTGAQGKVSAVTPPRFSEGRGIPALVPLSLHS